MSGLSAEKLDALDFTIKALKDTIAELEEAIERLNREIDRLVEAAAFFRDGAFYMIGETVGRRLPETSHPMPTPDAENEMIGEIERGGGRPESPPRPMTEGIPKKSMTKLPDGEVEEAEFEVEPLNLRKKEGEEEDPWSKMERFDDDPLVKWARRVAARKFLEILKEIEEGEGDAEVKSGGGEEED